MTEEEKIADLKANFDYFLEGKDLEIKELKDRLAEEVELHLHAEEYIKSLEKELAEWKEEWQEQVQKATDEGWERTKLTGRVRELEQQIEKMKCFMNCDYSTHPSPNDCPVLNQKKKTDCKGCKYWRLRNE